MGDVLALRPFVPARDFALSKRFYVALGFRVSQDGADVALLKLGGHSFILQDFYVPEHAGNLMVHLLVRDVAAWWAERDWAALAAEFGCKPARAPALQPWGLVVGFVFDPSGVLWHIAEAPF